MNKNIQFARIDVKKQSRAKQTALVFLGVLLLAVLSFFTVLSVRAYFTSTDTKSGELTFGTIEVKLLDVTSDFTASSFQTKYLTGIMPGSTLTFNSINVKNTGTHSAYVLLNLDVSIPSKDGKANKLLHYNKWFNANGEEVNTTNMAINQTIPTLIASGGSVTSNIQWKVPSIVGNDYKTSTVTVNMTVYGTQTNLKDAVAYANRELYASYFICSNASKIANDNGTTYSGATITQDPLRRIVTSKNLFNPNVLVASGFISEPEETTGEFTWLKTSGIPQVYINTEDNVQYTVSFKAKTVIEQTASITVYYTDGTYSFFGNTCSTSSFTETVGTTKANKTINYIKFGGSGGLTVNSVFTNLQIEKGTTATTYEAYSGVEDTFDINTQTLTRNVEKYEFKGTEAIGVGYDVVKADSSAVLQFEMANCVEVANYDTLGPLHCNMLENIKSTYISGSILEGIAVLPDDNAKGGWLRWRIDVSTYGGTTRENAKNEFKAWLKELYANGNPMTVWFQMENPTSETVLTSKNLYQGNQRLKYKTGASDNNINQPATITITQNAEYSFDNNPGAKELGGDLFDMMFNNPTVLSYKLKRNTDDVITNSRVSVNFMNGSNSLGNINAFFNAYDNDEEYHLIYIAIPKLSELTYSSTVDKVHINFADYSKVTSRDFIIKDIQIEVGSVPTDFECYDPTEYKRVNGVVLRQVGDVRDTYNASTKKITRNINELTLTGNESWQTAYLPTILTNLSTANYGLSADKAVVICSHAPSSSSGSSFRVRITNDTGTAIGFSQCFDGFGVSDLDGFKNYLKAEYVKGNPVRCWYVLKSAKTETLS